MKLLSFEADGRESFGSFDGEAVRDLGAVLGERFSALDIYVSAISRWRPGRSWFEKNVSRLAAIADATKTLPGLIEVWARNEPDG